MLPGSESSNGILSPSRTDVRKIPTTLSRLGRISTELPFRMFFRLFFFFLPFLRLGLYIEGFLLGGVEGFILFGFRFSIYC